MENAKQLRPIGLLLLDTWKTYQANCKKISLLMLWGLIGFVPYAVMIALSLVFGRQVGIFQIPLAAITFLFYLGLLYWIISTVLGLVILLKTPGQGIIEVFNAGRKLVWGYLAVALILFMFVSLWSLLFVIPGVIFYIFYAVTMFVFVYEGYRRSAALSRSKELVSGNWWPVFYRLAIAIAVMIALAVLYFYALNLLQITWLIAIIALVYYVAVFFLLVPLYITYLSLIYHDLAAIKPTGSLPKAKKDYWLVIVSAIYLVIALLIMLSFALFLVYLMQSATGL